MKTTFCILFLAFGFSALRAQSNQQQDTSAAPQTQDQQGWVQIPTPVTSAIEIVTGTNSDTVWAVAFDNLSERRGIIRSIDAGLTWSRAQTPVNSGSLAFYNSQIGYIGLGTQIYRTSDGGISWDSAKAGGANGANSICIVTTDTAYATFLSDVIRTTDQGKSWTVRQINGYLNAISFSDPLHGFAVGNQAAVLPDSPQVGVVFRTIDGGNTWQELYSGLRYDLHGVVMLDDTTLLTIGKGAIDRSVDAGMTWHETILTSAINAFTSIMFYNRVEGIIVGYNGKIYLTFDGGLTWSPESSGTLKNLYNAAFIDDTTIIAVGDSGLVLRTTNQGLSWVSNPPSYQSLNVEVYPNPSSSSTQLRFSLSEAQHVSLSIYAMDGSLIAQLLNQQLLTAGINTAVFKGGSLASGSYTYLLTSEKYLSTGKFQLVK